jgi:serine protease AprX
MLEAVPDLKPHEVKLALIKTAARLPNALVDRQGWGMVHPRAAIACAMAMRGIHHYEWRDRASAAV